MTVTDMKDPGTAGNKRNRKNRSNRSGRSNRSNPRARIDNRMSLNDNDSLRAPKVKIRTSMYIADQEEDNKGRSLTQLIQSPTKVLRKRPRSQAASRSKIGG